MNLNKIINYKKYYIFLKISNTNKYIPPFKRNTESEDSGNDRFGFIEHERDEEKYNKHNNRTKHGR